jgi:alpha-L-arabinofuranosidase
MILKKLITLFSFYTAIQLNAQIELTVDLNKPGVSISPMLYGIFFEDINHAADGGLYAELIKNRSFEDNANAPDSWSMVKNGNATGSITLDTNKMINTYQKHALKIDIVNVKSNERLGVANAGFWGINIVNGRKYSFTFFAKCDDGFNGKISVLLENTAGTAIYASDTITGLNTQWQKFSGTLTANNTNFLGRLVLSCNANGTVWIDVVSLFPPTFKERPNGLRPDLAQMLEDIKPKFMRFPGGCFVEGDSMVNAFRWKKTVGPIEGRPGHKNFWSYRTSDGMGFHEFLQLCEDIGSVPLYVTNCGMSHSTLVPVNQNLDTTVLQDALDAIEYANGSTSTKFGSMREANGHPEPFNIKYIEIGNEENFQQAAYEPRYARFYKAIKSKYPEINCIANSYVSAAKTDIIDEHYYSTPQFFMQAATKYDSYDRTKQKIYVGEYAVTNGCGKGNLIAALGEAAFMTGFERNSDVVKMASYAPIFVNDNDRNWNPDIINFNAVNSYETPSYYVQKLFSNNIGDVYIPVTEKNNIIPENISGKIGLGTWQTQAEYDDVNVSINGSTSFSDDFTSGSQQWKSSGGTWNAGNGVYIQSSLNDDCRSVSSENVTDSAYTYSVKAMKTGGNEGFLIIFGYKDKNNFYWWNIGGWGNTLNAIEKCVNGSKSTVSSASGKINTNQWYNIKILISNGLVSCYLDGALIHKFEAASRNLYVSNTLQIESKELITKVINITGSDATSTIFIKANTSDTILNGSATVLTSPNPLDENSFSNPVNVVPVTSNIEGLHLSFQYKFPAYSLTIFRLKMPNLNFVLSAKKLELPNGMVNIYPNPVINGNLAIDLSATIREKLIISVFDEKGSMVLQENLIGKTKQNVYVGNLHKGLYLVVIKGDDINESQKLLIQ